MPYLEIGTWFSLVSLGAGYTAGLTVGDGRRVPLHNVHLYLGVTIPVSKNLPLILVPYYRPSWGAGGGERAASIMRPGCW